MNKFLINSRVNYLINHKIFWVFFLWVVGLLSGIMSSLSFPVNHFFKLHFVNPQPSLFFAFLVHLTPILAIVAFVHFNKLFVCFFLCFVRAYCCGFTGMLLFLQLGSGIWALRFPFMFSGYCSSVLVLYYLLKSFDNDSPICFKNVFFLVAFVFGYCLIDVFIITPFLFTFLNYY